MTYEEAYDWLDEVKYLDLSESQNDDYKAVALAKSALERLILGEREWTPIATDKNGEADTYKCPICSNYVIFKYKTSKCGYEYCPHCGFKIND